MKPVLKIINGCALCGNRGRVMRAYVEKYIGLPAALELIQCPKCAKVGEAKVKELAADAAAKYLKKA
jgi:hypothetical protein